MRIIGVLRGLDVTLGTCWDTRETSDGMPLILFRPHAIVSKLSSNSVAFIISSAFLYNKKKKKTLQMNSFYS